MSSFTDFGYIKPLVKENLWVTTRELEFYENDDLTGKKIVVPCGFTTDGCSVKCPFGQSTEPRTISGCILHDYLYRNKKGFLYSNKMFLKAMKALGVGFFQRYKYYLGVSFFGWIIYYRIIK